MVPLYNASIFVWQCAQTDRKADRVRMKKKFLFLGWGRLFAMQCSMPTIHDENRPSFFALFFLFPPSEGGILLFLFSPLSVLRIRSFFFFFALCWQTAETIQKTSVPSSYICDRFVLYTRKNVYIRFYRSNGDLGWRIH